ncbi:cytochrome c oxidase subunit II [Chelativorans alearense]|uniref:cytochrome c oxidase subunit II n=1 Tax=Chelativorans alearense TaxID=2681495 RepID=UPI001FEA0A5D|nr:cytochrome c oxidase subunit II [Chelativorans alearense]
MAGCSDAQSVLNPHGAEAESIALLFWITAIGGALIWLAVVGALIYAGRRHRKPYSQASAARLVLWAGAVVPSILLAVLLGYALALIPDLRPLAASADDDRLHIEVIGEQFWWRVIYHPPDGQPVVSANEVRLPVGERVTFSLKSTDVIHSFWIPPLGGKMDMIPGRTNTFSLKATKAGIFRSPCTEFCGPSHALMAFTAVAMKPGRFDRWLANEGKEAVNGKPGLKPFLANGCGACHAIRGTEADGAVGPDLTHLASRKTLAAGSLPNTEDAIARFIAEPDEVKPGVRMPAFGMLPQDEIDAIAAYLARLE